MRVSDVLAESERVLSEKGVAQPGREAASLLAFALGRDRTFLIAHPEYELTDSEINYSAEIVSRRAAREPFQYITRRQEFYGLDFEVTPDVLIPRPETESLVEQAVALLDPLASPRFCEIGIGSGCISIAILKHVPAATALGSDLSEPALTVAGRNALLHRVDDRLELRASDLFSAIASQTFDLIVSNPPYVPVMDIEMLQPEVRDYEPRTALTDGGSGLSIIKHIITDSPAFLRPGGRLLIEFGFNQLESVKKMFDDCVWRDVLVINDLQGIPRTISAARI